MADFEIDDSVFEYDELKLFFREDYRINDYITIRQPTIGEIVEYGEQKYFEMISLLCVTSDSMKVFLWEIGQDWNKVSNFSVFVSMLPQLEKMDISLLFGDFRFDGFGLYENSKTGKPLLYDPEHGWEIDEYMYENIARYIRKLHGISYKPKRVKGKVAKEALIEKEKYELQEKEKESQGKPERSQLLDLVSTMLVYPGFKYKSTELKECGIFEFMNSVQRAQVIESSLALTQGAYTGLMDTKKINPQSFNWLRPLD